MSVIKMADLDLAGKRVLIREDLNVPVKNGVVTSDARLRAALPTIELALTKGAKVMVCSHLGRPEEGVYAEEFSMQPVVDYLKNALNAPVRLAKDYLHRFGWQKTICRVLKLPLVKWWYLKTCALTKVKARMMKPCQNS